MVCSYIFAQFADVQERPREALLHLSEKNVINVLYFADCTIIMIGPGGLLLVVVSVPPIWEIELYGWGWKKVK
jgi:hypothetical protein